jgi:hypothetical protein
VYVIQPGQLLFIPLPLATEGGAPDAADTPRLAAPLLVAPANGASLTCADGGTLSWQRVQFVKDSDKYVLHLGFVNGRAADGQAQVTWVLAQVRPVTQTEWTLDPSLCDLGQDAYDREWRWWVEVVEEAGGQPVAVSPPSEQRSFVWR